MYKVVKECEMMQKVQFTRAEAESWREEKKKRKKKVREIAIRKRDIGEREMKRV